VNTANTGITISRTIGIVMNQIVFVLSPFSTIFLAILQCDEGDLGVSEWLGNVSYACSLSCVIGGHRGET
jgi:hypothetical protein